MSTLNLGKLRFNWRGVYDSAQTYTRNDTVKHQQNSFVCIANTTTGAFNGAHWAMMAEGMHPATTQGDLITFENGNLVRKPIGADQGVLVSKEGKAEWQATRGGSVLVNRVYLKGSSGTWAANQNGVTHAWVPDLFHDYTPLRSDTRIRLILDYAVAFTGSSGMITHTILHMGGTEYGRYGTSGNSVPEQKVHLQAEVPSWGTTSQRCGLTAVSYSSSWGSRFHSTWYWGGVSNPQYYPPTLIIEEFKDS